MEIKYLQPKKYMQKKTSKSPNRSIKKLRRDFVKFKVNYSNNWCRRNSTTPYYDHVEITVKALKLILSVMLNECHTKTAKLQPKPNFLYTQSLQCERISP